MTFLQWAALAAGCLLLLAALSPLALDRIRRNRPADLRIEGLSIVIEPCGFFRLLARGTSLRAPVQTLAAAFQVNRQELGPAGLSTPTRRLPRWVSVLFPGLLAGTFHGAGGHSFWLCGQRAVAVRLDFVDGPYDFAVVQVEDPVSTVRMLRAIAVSGLGPVEPGPV